jgi:AcrR family transcriptional regulator
MIQLGYQEASVLDITEAADVSKRTFYLHFTDKEDVIEALAMRELETLRARIEAAEATEAAPDEVFGEGFRRTTRMIFEYVGTEHHADHLGMMDRSACRRCARIHGWGLKRICAGRFANRRHRYRLSVANAVAGGSINCCAGGSAIRMTIPDDMAAVRVRVVRQHPNQLRQGPEVPWDNKER